MPVNALVTTPFSGTAGAYVRHCMMRWLGRWWWSLALPVAVCAALSLWQPVWLFVALMLLCLLAPAVLAFIYYNYALSPQAVATLAPRTVAVDSQGLTLTDTATGKTERINKSNIAGVEDTGRCFIVNFTKPRYHHLTIPFSAIPDDIMQLFSEKIMALSPSVA